MRVHISLPVADLGRSVSFYRSALGQSASKLKDDYANFRLDAPAIHLALVVSNSPEKASGASHYGIELPDHKTLEQWRARATQDALDIIDDPDASCCYARADKFWLSDPDGNRWEFWVRTGESEVLQQSAAASCCG